MLALLAVVNIVIFGGDGPALYTCLHVIDIGTGIALSACLD